MKRLIAPLLLAVLIFGVGSAIYLSARNQFQVWQVATVHGLISSEKAPFFDDPRVVKALHDKGIIVEYEKAGSRSIATSYDLSKYDFAFPSGVPPAEKIRRTRPGAKSYDVFYSPMAVASWKPIAQILVDNGIAKDAGGYYTLDMNAYLKLVADGTRWNELKNNTSYPATKSLLISSTDVRESNSAAMYLALASYVANNLNVVESDAEVQNLSPLLDALFLKQGFTGYSSEEPFNDYLMMGPGKAPLVMIFESQWIAQAAGTASSAVAPEVGGLSSIFGRNDAQPQDSNTVGASGLNSQMVLMYPDPNIYSKSVLVALSPNGERLGQLLQNDPTLQHLAVEYGFRTNDLAYFKQFTQSHGVKVADTLVNVIDPPSYDYLEKMIQQITQQYQ